jgi:hypothetical protein
VISISDSAPQSYLKSPLEVGLKSVCLHQVQAFCFLKCLVASSYTLDYSEPKAHFVISIPINTLQILLEVLRPAMKMDQLGLLICKKIGGGGNLWYGIDDATNGGTKSILRWKLQKLTGTCITMFFKFLFSIFEMLGRYVVCDCTSMEQPPAVKLDCSFDNQ